MRVIDETGKQLGVMNLNDALGAAKDRNLDLIQITEKVEPPVCKIMDYGKFLYWQEKKEKETVKHVGGETKGIRLSFGISEHDMEIRVELAKKFLLESNKVRIEMPLRGREKALGNFAKEKVAKFLEILGKSAQYKIERELKREFGGFSMIISKALIKK